MRILFLTLVSFTSINEFGLYSDLLREFVRNGHEVFAISPVEKRQNQDTHLVKEDHSTILCLQIGNTQKTNIIEKGINTILIEPTFKKAIKQYFSKIKFDLVLYSTPPITLVSAVEYVKRRDGARTYLLLKDIFPQNAVDIGLMTTNGLRGLLYVHFRKKEKRLYEISDRIGCMSQANVDYVIKHNPEIDTQIVEVCPNSIEVIDKSVNEKTRREIREKYQIPPDKTVFVYGGNLGKPQGILFLIDCLKKCQDIKEAFFLIVGDGTEYHLLREYIDGEKPENARLMKRLSKEDYDTMIGACDVGLIFLDHRFTIPNFPSRMLSYMQAKLPVLACTDISTDVGRVIEQGEFGWWCESLNAGFFREIVLKAISVDLKPLKENAWNYLCSQYSVKNTFSIITNFMNALGNE